MSTLTTNLSLVKPALTDNADIAVINTNMDLLDAAVASKETPTGAQTKATAAQTAAEAYTDAKFPVGTSELATGAATDTIIGNRTGDPTLATPASTGTLTQLFGWLMGRIKAITGTTNWFDAPPTTLTAANSHMTNTSNPHSVTASQVGLGNATNTSDANKPVSTAQQAALDLKAPLASPVFTGTVTFPVTNQASASVPGLVEITAAPTSGAPIVSSQVASAKEAQITGTTAQTVATYTPAASGNFEARASFRVITGTTNVTIVVTYTSAGGAQTYTALNVQTCAVGEYSIVPFDFNAVAGSAITIKITASVANQVYASAGITGV